MKTNVKKMVLMAILSALAYLLVCVIQIPVFLFLSYEPKDVAITIGGFLLGPFSAFICSALVSLLEMITISRTVFLGYLMNVLSTCSFACTAAWIYKKRHNLSGAIIGLVAGSAVMVATMLLGNWLLTPIYMGQPREAVEAMLFPVFLPFNLMKAGLNTALTLILYKPVVSALRYTNLATASSAPQRKSHIGAYILGVVLLATCILVLLAWQGKL